MSRSRLPLNACLRREHMVQSIMARLDADPP